MIKVGFYLAHPKKEKSTIQAKLTYKKRKTLSLGISIPTKLWNTKKQQPKLSYQFYSPLMSRINSMKKSVDEYNEAAFIKGDFNLDDCISFINNINNSKDTTSTIDVEFKTWIENRYKNGTTSYQTYEKSLTSYKHLNSYLRYNNLNIFADDIDDKFISDFQLYLNTVTFKNDSFLIQEKKIIANKTASKYISRIKQFLKSEYNKAISVNVKYKVYPKFVLNEKELEILKESRGVKPYLENVRKLFLIEIYTALRVSDLQKLFKDVIVDFHEKKIRVPVKKTGQYINIPFLGNVEDLLMELQNDKIKMISSVKYNSSLKALFYQIGFDRKWQTIKEVGKERIIETKPIYELVSSHTARRTFVTISYKAGLRPEEIILITGHSSTKEIRPYLNLVEEEVHSKAKKVWSK